MKLFEFIKSLFFSKDEIKKNRINHDDAVKDLMRWGNYIEVQSKYI